MLTEEYTFTRCLAGKSYLSFSLDVNGVLPTSWKILCLLKIVIDACVLKSLVYTQHKALLGHVIPFPG